VNYFSLPEIAGFSAKTAAGFVSFYWGGAMIGRFIGAPLLRRFKAGYPACSVRDLCRIASHRVHADRLSPGDVEYPCGWLL